jgi:hypothetical protein
MLYDFLLAEEHEDILRTAPRRRDCRFMLCPLHLLTLCVSVSAALNSVSLYYKLSFLYQKCVFLYQNNVVEPVLCRDGLPVGVTSRLRCHETCPELLKELLRVLGETYEVPELLGEVLGGTGGSSGGPWEVLWAPWEVPWGPLGGSGKVLWGPLGAHRDGLRSLGVPWGVPEHECEALGGHWQSLGRSLEILGGP